MLDIEAVKASHVAAQDLLPLVVGEVLEEIVHHGPGLGKRRLWMRIVRAEGDAVDPDHVAVLDADRILLEAYEHVAPEEVTRQLVTLEPDPIRTFALRRLRIQIVHPVEEIGDPPELAFDRAHPQPFVALEDTAEDQVTQRQSLPVIGRGQGRRSEVAPNPFSPRPMTADVQADGDIEVLRR